MFHCISGRVSFCKGLVIPTAVSVGHLLLKLRKNSDII